ncbi:MAG: replication restart helicase PriA [Bacteroidota bacterium]
MERYIKIAAGIPADKLFTYKTIQPPERKIKGCRALIPFGNRTLTGVIVDETEKPENIDIKEIIELLDEKPVFSDNMLNFTRWMADYYMASWGETLKSALPSGLSPKSVIRVERTWESSSGIIPSMKKKAPRRAAVLEAILRHEEDISIGFLENITGLQGITPQLYALEQEGLIKVHRVIVNRARSKTQKAAYIPDEILSNDEALKDIFDELDKSAPKQSLVLSNIFISQSDTSSPKLLTEIKEVTGDSGSAVKALEKKGIIKIIDLELDRNLPSDKYESLARRNEAALKLTAEQSRAADLILEKIDIGEFHPFLLHGVTGSGKTLVYMKAIKKALDSGRQALLLVPEISLTPQLIDRFELSFPGKIAVLHSRMSEGERFDSWRSIVSGKATLVIGARSAIFAPLDNPGLIIVDEEHEHSYKQEDPAPRYHARDAALVRARMDNAVAVLGSATPSIESMYNAKTGKYTLLEITSRADGASMPIIRVIDVLDSWKHGKMKGYFSEGLIEAISSRVQKNEGVIIFQNMRGYSSSLQCRNCGYVPECTNCDVTLTFHKNIAQLRCHYCGHAEEQKIFAPIAAMKN